jgi:hypothetical protein
MYDSKTLLLPFGELSIASSSPFTSYISQPFGALPVVQMNIQHPTLEVHLRVRKSPTCVQIKKAVDQAEIIFKLLAMQCSRNCILGRF